VKCGIDIFIITPRKGTMATSQATAGTAPELDVKTTGELATAGAELTDTQQPQAGAAGKWSCSGCTYLNFESASNCSMCHSTKQC
jgi:hypothetical protein